jgi:aryl-alcohol dehydrogenase-like predicted oxidoreductase
MASSSWLCITTSTDEQYPQVLDALGKLKLDFLQVDYSIDNRGAEEKILPLAREKGVAVLINVPLGGRRGSVLSKVAGKPLPAWAADYDATSWAQLLLKYSISHPAVTAVIPGTTKLAHLQDNQLAGRGRLPDAAGRKRIEELWATIA